MFRPKSVYFDGFASKILILILALGFCMPLTGCSDDYGVFGRSGGGEDAELSEGFTTAPIIEDEDDVEEGPALEVQQVDPNMQQFPGESGIPGVLGGLTIDRSGILSASDRLALDKVAGFKGKIKSILRQGVNKFEKALLGRMHAGPIDEDAQQSVVLDVQSLARLYPQRLAPNIIDIYASLKEGDNLSKFLSAGEQKLLHMAYLSLFQGALHYELATMGLHKYCTIGYDTDLYPGEVSDGRSPACDFRYSYLNTHIYKKWGNPCRNDIVQDNCGYIGTSDYKMTRDIDNHVQRDAIGLIFTPRDLIRETINQATSLVLTEMKTAMGQVTEPMLGLNKIVMTGGSEVAQESFAVLGNPEIYECLMRFYSGSKIRKYTYSYRWINARIIVTMMYLADFVDRDGAINYFMDNFLATSVDISCIEDQDAYATKWRAALNLYFDAIDAQLAAMN